MANMVFFGAGASSGSQAIYPRPPPLGQDLFNELRINFQSTWGSIPVILMSTLSSNFEDGMAAIFSSNFSFQIPQLMRNMAEFFCQFQIKSYSNNLYSRLLDSLKPSLEDLIFSSLNYDLLLEHAATYHDLVINYFLDRQDKNELLFWKLHGSCNFLPGNIQLDGNILFQAGIVWDTSLRGEDPRDVVAFCRSQTGLYPAMCLYMRSKPTQIGYTQIKAIQQKWKEAVIVANKILIIGIKPCPIDTHIWEPLTQTKAKIGFVGSYDGYEYWINQGRNESNTEFIGQKWDSCFYKTITFMKS